MVCFAVLLAPGNAAFIAGDATAEGLVTVVAGFGVVVVLRVASVVCLLVDI